MSLGDWLAFHQAVTPNVRPLGVSMLGQAFQNFCTETSV